MENHVEQELEKIEQIPRYVVVCNLDFLICCISFAA